MSLETVKERAVREYYPDTEELEKSKQIFNEIKSFIKKEFDKEAHFAGSASRATCMTGDKDIDVFILFSQDTSREDIEQEGLNIGKKVFEKFGGDYHVEYAEHPYTKGKLKGHEVEIVPCYDVEPENIKSAVDRTPHHTRWAKENLDKQQRKDVVVLKAFLQAQGLYGSSLKLKGFSGYLCEILISYYGSFEELVKQASNWEREKRIEAEKSETDFESDFVVIDPVDPERNVAAVLSNENYAKFIYSCWKLSQDPSYSMFEDTEEFNEFKLKKEVEKRAEILTIHFERPERVDDIIYPQMRKMKRVLEKKLKKNDFRIYSSGEFAGEEFCRIFLEVDRKLPEIQVVKGPQVYHNSEHLKQFTSKYENVFVRDQRLCAKIDREYGDAQKLLQDFLDEDSSGLEMKGVPNFLAPKVEESKFVDPVSGGDKWLKYLYQEFNCD